jgi:transcription initiation factor TFIIIB Brf1 subunit/transcription initiation factor TFIIB
MKIEKMDIMPENTPPSIAAGVVYFVSQICKLNISKRDVKNVSETSEVTINKCYKKLEKITKDDNIIPAAIFKKYNISAF